MAAVVKLPASDPGLRSIAENMSSKIAKGRELRDRYLEQFNSGLVLGNAKYDVTKALPVVQSSADPVIVATVKALPVAA